MQAVLISVRITIIHSILTLCRIKKNDEKEKEIS